MDETNARIREAKRYAEAAEEEAACKTHSETLSNDIQSIDVQKQEILSAAKLPAPGLSINESGVTLNGIPFDQSALSEKLKTGVAIAMALNPEFRVIRITDASLLDPENMARD